MKKVYFLFVIFYCLQLSLSAQNFWEQTNGIIENGGFIRSLVSNSKGYIFTATDNGIFRSMDNGNNWIRICNGLSDINILTLAISQNDYIFAGTNSGHLFRSTDDGNNWVQSDYGLNNLRVPCIAINSKGEIFAGTLGGRVFCSTNNGEKWISASNGIDPQAGTWITYLIVNSKNYLFAASPIGIYRSMDNGENWALINENYYVPYISAFSISKSDEIYIGTFIKNPGGTHAFTYRSSNNGDTWEEFQIEGSPNIRVTSFIFNNTGNLFAGTAQGIFRSTNKGDDWEQLNNDPTDLNIITMTINSNGDIFAESNYNIYITANNGESWTKKSNGLFHYIPVLVLAANSKGYVFAGTENTIFTSIDNGDNWNKLDANFTGVINSLAINSRDHIFLSTTDGIYRSTDEGNTWIQIHSRDSSSYYDAASLAINSNDEIYAGTLRGIYRSADNGDSWTYVAVSPNGWVGSIAFNSKGNIFAGTGDYGVYRSTDDGKTWMETNNGLNNLKTVLSTGDLFVSSNDYIFVGNYYSGIFRSTDNGDSWIQTINYNLTAPDYCFTENSGNFLFASTWGKGVFASNNNGNNWFPINDGLTDLIVGSIIFNTNGYLFAITRDHGIFRSVNSTTKAFPLISNLTFPFNNSIDIPTNPELKWNNTSASISSASISYELQISADSTFSRSVFNYTALYDTSLVLNFLNYATTYFWHVKTIINDKGYWSKTWKFTTNSSSNSVSTEYILFQNYPNPFNSNTKIEYSIYKTLFVTLKVYDVLGRKVLTLVNGEKPAGNYEVNFNGGGLSSGIYFYKIQAGNFTSVKKMILIK